MGDELIPVIIIIITIKIKLITGNSIGQSDYYMKIKINLP